METVYLTIHYGPYRANGIIRHKLQRLHGLIELLVAENYAIDIIPSPHLNRLTISIMDHEIFSCDVRHLMFNLSPGHDHTCQRALEMIQDHVRIFYKPENRPQFPDISRKMRSAFEKPSEFDFYVPTPQTSFKSGLLRRFSSCHEFTGTDTDICKDYGYYGYDLKSCDLDLIHDLDQSSLSDDETIDVPTTSSSKSGFSEYDYWYCDELICAGVQCPPASLAGREKSYSELSFGEYVGEDEYFDDEGKRVTFKDESDVGVVGDGGLYKCVECGECYCICVK